MTTKSDDKRDGLRARLAGKPLLGFDTSAWAGTRDAADAGRTAFAMVGGKEERYPARLTPSR